ncbi:uncharacterized protein HMPREF1541_10139 [Cyphellophora europaea CBS 101466]|uniref:ABC transporter domain-containing protein n=1 Tax=Cyphellophora europaea (strain CBS 101466) TaxID=1220924 RepID=W2S993_CYPE1|nr:uncharacterized protein HMPREF1541_10139 [Cyphellophora europaea CBS 101466]ETN44469.1 hypothetical protein HMPREF1541_10139 [Cyphellophora europaea CBS 101466]
MQQEHYASGTSSETGSILRQTLTTKSTIPEPSHPEVASRASYEADHDEHADYANNEELSRLATNFTQAVALQPTATDGGMDSSNPQLNPSDPSFSFKIWCKYLMRQLELRGMRRPRVNTTFRNLTVTGTGNEIMIHKTVGSMFMTPFGFASVNRRRHSPKRTILHSFNGAIREGEMCIVLGRPGSGCSTFLKAISGHLDGAKINEDSSISYNGIPQHTYIRNFRGEILYNQENEQHFSHLTVGQTLWFASASRAPSTNLLQLPRDKFVDYCVAVALNLFGLTHAQHTRVGNDYVRGVSGGERKRVSIAEMALTGALMGTWDNSTRGLDSATALEFVRTLRTAADTMGTSHTVAIYQASQSTYDLFDKATVLYQGRQIYFGPAQDASAYFESMGWERPPRMTTGDFLTSVTNPTERKPRHGFEAKVPRTPIEFEKHWLESEQRKVSLQELDRMTNHVDGGDHALHQFQEHHNRTQSKHSRQASPYRISVPAQIRLCVRRFYQRMWNDRPATISKIIAQTVQALIVGSIFYNTPVSTDAFFAKGSVLFCVVLVNTLMSVAEIPAVFAQRPIVEKHTQYALYHPSSEALAGVIADFPVKMLTSTLFGVILYFLAGLKKEAGAFFTFYLFTTGTMLTMSACFRSISAASKSNAQAMGFAGIGILAIIIYTGFSIQRPLMQPWFEWISYINPVSYVFEALLTNEVHGVLFPCAMQALVPPYGQGESFQCAMPGAIAGQRSVLGDSWVESAYDYHFSHLWRNFGILVAFMVAFYGMYLVLSELNWKLPSTGEVLVFRRGHQPKTAGKSTGDVEASNDSVDEKGNIGNSETANVNVIPAPTEVFTWKNVCYDVPVEGGTRRLLDNISGYVKPGQLTALMGTSGAGKTTLLDVLAKRTNVGVVTGDMLVNGRHMDSSFQRKTGYVQQQDVHLSTSTVREALQFSALLRQPHAVPKHEKFAFVEEVIKMLGMEDFAEAIVGSPGEGLNIEQRKLLTIGVELAAKPALLIFLDEPTSGLDSQSSWSIISLLRRLADNGQAILTTIHQPSAMLFQQFDRLLFLQKGGKTVYFGDIGTNSRALINYFESGGARPCGNAENPAEYILEVVAGKNADKSVDWYNMWKASTEAKSVQSEINQLHIDYAGSSANTKVASTQYAMPVSQQFWYVTKRVFQQYWRTPSYVLGKLGLVTASALFVGFSFWQPDDSQAGMQNTIFAIFMVLTIFTPLVQQIMPRFVAQRSLYEVRERPSRMYSWSVFMVSNILVEIPWQLLAGVLVFISWYFAVFDTTGSASTSATMLAFCLTFYMYVSSFAFMLIAALPDAPTAGPIAALLFSLMITFSGVLQKPSSLPSFWKFMWRVSPMTYLMGGWAGAGLQGHPVNCAQNELAIFNPPNNSTCATYLQPYFQEGAIGRLLNPEASTSCQYCSLQNADQFLALSDIHPGDVYRNLGICYAYIIFNTAAAILFYYLFRVKRVKVLRSAVEGVAQALKKARGH